MSAWDDDDLPGLPPRLGAAMEFERQHGRGETSAEVDTSEVLGDNPTTKLLRVLMNERYAPELLPWEGQLVEDVLEKLHQQSQMVEYLRSDDTTSEDEHFRMSYVQLDMERIKFQIRSYVRTRLYKSHNGQSRHPISHVGSGTKPRYEVRPSYKNLFKAHMHRTVLDNLPEGLRSLNETFPDGRSMGAFPTAEFEPRNIHLRDSRLRARSTSRVSATFSFVNTPFLILIMDQRNQRRRRQGFHPYFPIRDY
ncbi:Sld5 domain-containing protein [Rhizoctonia solani AG-1 IA]|uniref:Sld5 domain-containing protein n=1 Tax=Thanatephorus cucumeris (strain AG1-IA) TaxID=983506 RepID=L8WHE5_THACA|nr:Sld5 domain-containing protein [Rhizoctonia solani AG-1 IA]